MQVRDLMTSEVLSLHPGESAAALRDLMYENDIRHVPVVDEDGDLVGLVSQRDLLRRSLVEQPDVPRMIEDEVLARMTVDQLMTTGVETTETDADLAEAARTMFENKFGCLPVVEARRLVGILTEADFVRLYAGE